LSIEDSIVEEKAGNAYVTVRLSRPSTETITVKYATDDDVSAVIGVAYYGASGLLIFNPGELEKIITLSVLDDAETKPMKLSS